MEYISSTPQALDSQRTYELDLFDGSNPPVSLAGQFTGGETFGAAIWAGGSLPALGNPAVAWLDVAAAKLGVTVTPAMLVGLEAATYRLMVLINPGTDNVKAFDGLIRLAEAPGAASAPLTYCTEADMLLFAPWLEDLQSERDWAGFLHQRGRARSWLDDILLSKYKWDQAGWWSGSNATAFWTYVVPQYDPGPNKWLRDQLGTNVLIVRDLTREIVARKAISYVCEAQVGRDPKSPYQALGTRNAREAAGLLKTYRAEIDTDGDGYYDILINCGATSCR